MAPSNWSESSASSGVRAANACAVIAPPISDNDKIEAGETRSLMINLLPGQDRGYSGKRQDWKARRCRDLALFLLGTAAGALGLLCGGLAPSGSVGTAGEPDGLAFDPCKPITSPAEPPKAEPWRWPSGGKRAERLANASAPAAGEVLDPPGPDSWHVSSEQASAYAFVLMAHDVPDLPMKYIWQAVAIARALQRLSQYPVLLLTNTTHLPDGTSVADTFWKLNMQVLPLYRIPVPERVAEKMMPVWKMAFWKLQIWRLTQYEKLIWVDTDAIIFRSIDYMFRLEPTWGQKDAWVCSNNTAVQDWLCSGLMLIRPDENVYRGILDYAARSDSKWWENGDQKLIDDYFRHIARKPVQLLDISEAAFGKCLNEIPSLIKDSKRLPWSIPAFVHKSSVTNECFYFLIEDQLREVKGTLVNVCHHHPLGAYWRDHFCEGISILGTKTEDTETFCDDGIWYRQA